MSMMIIARPFPHENHTCINHLSFPKDPCFELIQDTFKDTCIADTINVGETVQISKTKCEECNQEYNLVEGIQISCLLDKHNKILRGYKSK
jgi:hypothetical protein